MFDPGYPSSISPVRPEWIHTLYNASQRAIGVIELDDAVAVAIARDLTNEIPDPASPLEERLLDGHLLALAVRWAGKAHRRLHAGADTPCTFQADVYLRDVWMAHPGPAKAAFREWCDGYFDALRGAHRDQIAEAARWIRMHSASPLSVAAVARHVGLHTVALRRQFYQQFGVTLREYHVRARLIQALRFFLSDGHDARSALHAAGWSSPKCFYRLLLRVTGRSVRQIRALDSESVLRLVALPGAKQQGAGSCLTDE